MRLVARELGLYSPSVRGDLKWRKKPNRGISWAGVPQIKHLAMRFLLGDTETRMPQNLVLVHFRAK
jgi:hypothetical protein